MRVFIAIELSKSVKKELGKLLDKLERKHWKVRWVEAEKLHITLAFLGKIEKEKLKRVKEGVEGALRQAQGELSGREGEAGGQFKIGFKGLGVFPDFDYPRVIWLGLKGDLKGLAALQKAIEKRLIDQGFEIKRRKFYPHLTLGRIKPVRFRERREIGRQLKKMKVMDFKNDILVDKVTVFESKLSPKGAKYKVLVSRKLGA